MDSPGTVQAVGREQPPHGEEAARRFTLVVAGMRADHAATWLGELAQEPVILDPVLAGRRVDMDLTDASLAEAIAIFAAACDADAEALPGGGYRLRVRPTPRAQ